MTQTAVASSLPGLSDTRLQEIERMLNREARYASGSLLGAVLLDEEEIALDDLLAEVRRLQQQAEAHAQAAQSWGDAEAAYKLALRTERERYNTLLDQLASAREETAQASQGVALIAAERARQVNAEGWTPEHDDEHTRGEMAITAACYAANGTDAEVLVQGEDAFPWGSCHDKRHKHERVRQLTIAGALIAAEIDRLARSRSLPGETADA